MSADGPLALVIRIAAILDDLDIPYALGGSMASSFFGEPRATADVDIAIRLNAESGESFLERALAEFYVPTESARAAIQTHQSFNLLADSSGLKADLFVVGDGLLDRRQLERRVLVPMPNAPAGLWVTSPEDQVLRKLDWYRLGGSVSDRQWRDVVGIILVRGASLDLDYLRETAGELDLLALLESALADAAAAE